jgi:hypothetical protein
MSGWWDGRPRLLGLYPLACAFLNAVPRDDAGVHVQGEVVEAQLAKMPAEQMVTDTLVGRLVKLGEEPLVGIVSRHRLPAKDIA